MTERTKDGVMIRASIDLGTNTCLLLIVDWDPHQKKIREVLGDYSQVVRLGEGVDHARQLEAAPQQRTLACLKEYAELVRQASLDPAQVICVATSQARDAQNSSEFLARVRAETGLNFRVLSGEEEAQATFVGALLPGMDPQSSAVIDIGGGSTELIALDHQQSLNIGSVRFTERYFKPDRGTGVVPGSPVSPVSDEEFWACQQAIDMELTAFLDSQTGSRRQALFPGQDLRWIAVAGTATTLAAWHLGLREFDPKQVDSVTLTRGDVHRMVEELKWRTVEERLSLPCMEPLRADVILAGALILWRTLELLGIPSCQVSTRGLRYGVLLTDLDE